MDAEFVQVRLRRATYALLESLRNRLTEQQEAGRNALTKSRATKAVTNEAAIAMLLEREAREYARKKAYGGKKATATEGGEQ